MTVVRTNLENKKDMINAQNTSAVLKNLIGTDMKMYGYVIYEDSEGQTITAIKTADGFIGSTSENVRETVEGIADVFDEAEFKAGIDFTVESSTSKNGRDFLTLRLI